MTYIQFLAVILVRVETNRRQGRFQGICQVASARDLQRSDLRSHQQKLGNQIDEDAGRYFTYLDSSWVWRVRHGNILPRKFLTNKMRNNMRISYLKSLIAKEEANV